mgnify:CR=1 FL=1
MNSQGSGYVWGWNAFSQVFDDASMAGLTDYNVAVYVPSTYAKAVIDSVYSVFSSGTYSNFKIWVSAYETDGQYIILPSTPEEADYCENIGDHQVYARLAWLRKRATNCQPRIQCLITDASSASRLQQP